MGEHRAESFVIGFDFTENNDITVLVVAKVKNNQSEIVKMFKGEDAEKLYKILIEKES